MQQPKHRKAYGHNAGRRMVLAPSNCHRMGVQSDGDGGPPRGPLAVHVAGVHCWQISLDKQIHGTWSFVWPVDLSWDFFCVYSFCIVSWGFLLSCNIILLYVHACLLFRFSYQQVIIGQTPLMAPLRDEETTSTEPRWKRLFLCIFPLVSLCCLSPALHNIYFIRLYITYLCWMCR